MAALAVAAVASPAAGDSDINSLKIRPSTESFINTFWVAGLLYNIFGKKRSPSPTPPAVTEHVDYSGARALLIVVGLVALLALPLWFLGACRTVLSFAAFQRATGSFALGRNVQLVDGYMLQLREEGGFQDQDQQQSEHKAVAVAVPRLIVTGERNQDVVESPLGYHVKRSSRWTMSGRVVVYGRRTRISAYPSLCSSAKAGSSWPFRFVCADGLLGPADDHERIFKVIATELSFLHKPLPVASLGTMAAALHFLLSLIISPSLLLIALILLLVYTILVVLSPTHYWYPLELLALVLTLVNASTEVSEMVASVRSNWTKISIIGHLVRSRLNCSLRFLAWLLKCCKAPTFWDDEIRQTQMLQPDLFVVQQPCPCVCSRRRFFRRQLPSLLGRCWSRRNHHDHHLKQDPIKVPLAVKEAILESLRCGGGQLSDGTAALRRHFF